MGLEPLPDLPPSPDRELLAVCGGGYAGLFAAEVLRRIEAQTGTPCRTAFDLAAGTSIGGIIVLGLAHGVEAARISGMVRDVGPPLFTGRLPSIRHPRHRIGPLRRKLEEMFEDARLQDLPLPVVVPAVDMTSGQTVVFGNHPSDPTRGERLVDVALATSAAPVYFRPHVADHRMFADGGLAANSPEAVAAVEAVHVRRWPAERTAILVVGSTLNASRIPGHLLGADWGALRWLRHSRLVATASRAQSSLARRTSMAILGPDRVIVVDDELTGEEARVVGLDKADRSATQALETLAAEGFARLATDHAGYLRKLARRRAAAVPDPRADDGP